ncbi:MAG: aminopeptidase [Promethearchaeota archaeon]
MSEEFKQNLDKYADVILKVGLNLQQGQRLLVGVVNPINKGTPLELASFIRLIVQKAYQMGAKFVEVMWDDPQLTLIRLQHAPRDSFKEVSIWRKEAALEFSEKGDAILAIAAQDPELFIGQDPELIMTQSQVLSTLYKPVMELLIKNNMNWAMVAAPVDGWAEKVFTESPSEATNRKLWDTIFDICRIKQEDPVSAWEDHINNLKARCEYLNKKQYEKLKVIGPGTDLTIGLAKNHIWRGGNVTSKNGITFVPNLPTEEIFTIPDRNKTEGFVKATKPLFFGGALLEDFSFTFSNGKVVETQAAKGKEYIENFLNYDEGAKYLGEIAIVPHSSPISQSGLLFYNGLIDENASIHIALGSGYKFSIENGEEMSDKKFTEVGGNLSILHMDFMIGSDQINIDGIRENESTEPIIRNGEWVFNGHMK